MLQKQNNKENRNSTSDDNIIKDLTDISTAEYNYSHYLLGKCNSFPIADRNVKDHLRVPSTFSNYETASSVYSSGDFMEYLSTCGRCMSETRLRSSSVRSSSDEFIEDEVSLNDSSAVTSTNNISFRFFYMHVSHNVQPYPCLQIIVVLHKKNLSDQWERLAPMGSAQMVVRKTNYWCTTYTRNIRVTKKRRALWSHYARFKCLVLIMPFWIDNFQS